MKNLKKSAVLMILLAGIIAVCSPAIKNQSGSAGIDEIEKNNEVTTK